MYLRMYLLYVCKLPMDGSLGRTHVAEILLRRVFHFCVVGFFMGDILSQFFCKAKIIQITDACEPSLAEFWEATMKYFGAFVSLS